MEQEEEKKSGHGGKRAGAGKPKGVPHSNMTFRVETAKKQRLKEKYGNKLNTMFKAWLDELLLAKDS